MSEDYDLFEALLRRSLERGVPTEAAADIFEMPLDVIREMAKEVKVKRFNTADQGEYLEYLQWLALERTEATLRNGSPDQVARITTAVFGRQIQAAGRRPSSALEEQRADFMELFASVREAPSRRSRPGSFVVSNVATDRRAHQSEDEDE